VIYFIFKLYKSYGIYLGLHPLRERDTQTQTYTER